MSRNELYIHQLENECARLTSGPGGIMEMKQTISDKEQEIERLKSEIVVLTDLIRDTIRAALEGKKDA